MKPRLVFAYRYGALGGVTTQLLGRLESFRSRFDVQVLFERDFGALSLFEAGTARVVSGLEEQIEAISQLSPDIFAVIDAGWREAWIRAGSPGKLVLEVHTTTTNLTFLEELRSTQRIDLIVVASRFLADLLARRGVADIAPVEVVPNCLPSSWAIPASAWTAPAPMLLWIGRLEPHKGVGRFIDLCDALEDNHTLPVLVGGTTDTIEQVNDTTERLFGRSRHLTPIWLPRVAYEHMPRLYASVANSGGALAITSSLENFPMTVVEATMQGCPVVAPGLGGLPELLPPDALYPDEDNPAAGAILEKIVSDRAFGARLSSATKEIIQPLVRPERALAAYVAALERAL